MPPLEVGPRGDFLVTRLQTPKVKAGDVQRAS
jgi:hypothetical protein